MDDISGADSPTAPARHSASSIAKALRLVRYKGDTFDKVHRCGSMCLTASQVPALFMQSRFAGRYSLAAHIMGRVPLDPPPNVLMQRGKLLEPIFAEMIRDEVGWDVHQLKHYARHRRLPRLIASPDHGAVSRDRPEPGIIEGKVVGGIVFQDRWADEPPLDVQLQLQTQFACTGATWGAVAALVVSDFRFDMIVYPMEPDPATIKIIAEAAESFLAMADAGQMPDPDEHPSSINALAQIYPQADPGKIVRFAPEDAPEAQERWDAWNQARLDRLAAEKIETANENWFFTRAIDAGQILIGNDRRIDVKTVRRKGYTKKVEPSSYRKWELKRGSDAGPEQEAA